MCRIQNNKVSRVNMDPLSAILSSRISIRYVDGKNWSSKARLGIRLCKCTSTTSPSRRATWTDWRERRRANREQCCGQSVLLEHKGADIEMGDTHSLNGKVVVNPGSLPSTMVERLISERPRPLTIRFARKSQPSDHVDRDTGSVTLLEPSAGEGDLSRQCRQCRCGIICC
jgi:hypothetical protein